MSQHDRVSTTIKNPAVAAVFTSYPPNIRTKLMFLRHLIFDTAASLEGVGEIEETLKWGEPSYLTPHTKSGSTVRIAWKASQPDQYGMYFKCTANLVAVFRERYPQTFSFGGNRSILFTGDDEIPVHELTRCIALAAMIHIHRRIDENPCCFSASEAARNLGRIAENTISRLLFKNTP